ncbi:MAG: GNAT family N-acetyltransferase [Atopobiaceae bacterium]|nr:GNAT family N-acetyltransferase [Atopobiaceae bacterium]
MSWPVTLTSDRLTLREWRQSDAEALFEYASDPEVGPAAGWLPHKDLDESREVIENILAVPHIFAICISNPEDPAYQDKAVGSIGLKIGEESDLAIGSDQAELGFWMAHPLWNHGYMTEAVREVMRYGFESLGLEAIWAGHSADNIQSKRVQQKVGLHYQRSIKDRPRRVVGDYKTEDVNWITRDEWDVLNEADPVDAATVHAQNLEADEIIGSIANISQIRSGGQTGADRGALDAARDKGVAICGWCPPGGLAEDMPEAPGLLKDYPELKESPSEGYIERTAWNVRDSHATLIVAPAGIEPKSGTEMTLRFAEQYERPHLVVRTISELADARQWLDGLERGIILNVAGPRESKTPGTYAITRQIVGALLEHA